MVSISKPPGDDASAAGSSAPNSLMPKSTHDRSHIKSLKIAMESTRRCPGTCGGCMLETGERRLEAGYKEDTKSASAKIIDVFIEDFFTRFHYEDITEAEDHGAIQFLQGDHLQMPLEEIDDYVGWASSISGGRMRAYFSTSCIGRTHHIKRVVDAYAEAGERYKQPISFLTVIDPKKVKPGKFTEIFNNNIDYVRTVFPLQEPAFNLGPDIRETSPQEIDAFMKRHGFYEADFGLFPTVERVEEYAANWNGMIDWVHEFIDMAYSQGEYTVSFPPLLASIMDETEDLSFNDYIWYLAGYMSEHVYIDNTGRLYSLLAGGLGNVVPLSERFGFDPFCLVTEVQDEFTMEQWHQQTYNAARRLISDYTRDPVCSSCPHQRACAGSGLSLVRHVMKKGPDVSSADGCPIAIRGLLDWVADNFREGKEFAGVDFGSDAGVAAE